MEEKQNREKRTRDWGKRDRVRGKDKRKEK